MVGCLIREFVLLWKALKGLLFFAKETLSEEFKLFVNAQEGSFRQPYLLFLRTDGFGWPCYSDDTRLILLYI